MWHSGLGDPRRSCECRPTRRVTPTPLWSRSGVGSRQPTSASSFSSGATQNAQLDAIETALRAMLRPGGVHPAIAFALTAFNRIPLATNIGAVTDAIGISAKRFIERFKAQVGGSPKALLSDSAVPVRACTSASRPGGRLAASRTGVRVLRPGALHSRIPGVFGAHADQLSRISDSVSEPRQISTIRRSDCLTR